MARKYFTAKIFKLIVALIVCAVLIFFNPKEFFSPVRGFLWQILLPFQKIFYGSSQKINETIFFLNSLSEIKKDNEKLFRENNFLEAQLANFKQIEEENKTLREQLELLPRDKFSLIGGFVIGLDPQGSESWIIFDKGMENGISSGMAVIVSNGILIGKVDEVYANSAKVNLLTGANNFVNVVDVETGAKGIIHGEYGLGLVMDMVTQTDNLNVGDTVITSGLGSNIPRGLLVGKIKEVKNLEDRLFQKAVVVSRIKYSKLDTVFAIKK